MVGPERHQPLGETAIGDDRALQPRQRLGTIGFLDDVERLRRRLLQLALASVAAIAAPALPFSGGFIAGSFPDISKATLLSDRLRRGALASACGGAGWPRKEPHPPSRPPRARP